MSMCVCHSPPPPLVHNVSLVGLYLLPGDDIILSLGPKCFFFLAHDTHAARGGSLFVENRPENEPTDYFYILRESSS